MTRKWMVALVLGLAACTTDGSENICQVAADHVTACLGQPRVAVANNCDAAQAQNVLGADCAWLAGGGKADWWNNFKHWLSCLNVGITISEPQYFVGLYRGSTEAEARAKAEELSQLLDHFVQVARSGGSYYVVYGSCPTRDSEALATAIRLKNNYGLNPWLIELSDRWPGCDGDC